MPPPQKRIGLRIHAIVFASSMVLMLIINLLTGAPYWVVWVLLAWGVGILSHWLAVRSHLVREARTGRAG
jgi:2TM domain